MVTAVIVGLALLVYFAALIGTSMDTARQRTAWRAVAAERRNRENERLSRVYAGVDHYSIRDDAGMR